MIASLHCLQKRDYPILPVVSISVYIFIEFQKNINWLKVRLSKFALERR
jgi:hypothetical protein